MSILDENYVDEKQLGRDHIQLTLQLLHEEGWRFTYPSINEPSIPYPEVSSFPIHGLDPWNPYWMLRADTQMQLHLSFVLGGSMPSVHMGIHDWDVFGEPSSIDLQYKDTWYRLRTLGDMDIVYELIEAENYRTKVLRELKSRSAKISATNH